MQLTVWAVKVIEVNIRSCTELSFPPSARGLAGGIRGKTPYPFHNHRNLWLSRHVACCCCCCCSSEVYMEKWNPTEHKTIAEKPSFRLHYHKHPVLNVFSVSPGAFKYFVTLTSKHAITGRAVNERHRVVASKIAAKSLRLIPKYQIIQFITCNYSVILNCY